MVFEKEQYKETLEQIYQLMENASDSDKMKELVSSLTYIDQDIGVYNLHYFTRIVESVIEEGKLDCYGACYFNLKRFSMINQQLGRRTGTYIMHKFARQLQELLGDAGIVCRVTGDKFIVWFLKDSLNIVMDYLKGTEICYDEESGEKILIEVTAGYYVIPDSNSCEKASDIIDFVEVAEHVAADVVYKPYVFFDDEMMQKRRETKEIEVEFRQALKNEEFLVYYQPKVGLRNYRLAGAEALCRWKHDGKIVPPIRFIPVLEQSQAICELDFYMLDHVCQDIRRWLDEGKEVVKVSVNFSRRHMENSDFVENILEVVNRHQVPHQYVEIELTETTTDVEFRDLKKIVSNLQLEGFSTAVDDFGVGYSSLNLIRELPWDVLKIDKSFLPAHADDADQKNVMFKYLIAMAQSLGLECIVEGVETIEQVRILKENNCYMAQGFYFDRPLPVEDFEARLSALN